MKNTIILILSLLVIGLGSYVIFDKVINKNDSSNENTSSSKTENSVSVVDAVNYKEGYLSVRLPKITGNTESINQINNKILNEVLPKTNTYSAAQEEVKGSINENSKIEYQYDIANNVLILQIYSSNISMPATNGGNFNTNYFYDILNDKELTLKEAADKIGYEIEYTEGPVLYGAFISDKKIIMSK